MDPGLSPGPPIINRDLNLLISETIRDRAIPNPSVPDGVRWDSPWERQWLEGKRGDRSRREKEAAANVAAQQKASSILESQEKLNIERQTMGGLSLVPGQVPAH